MVSEHWRKFNFPNASQSTKVRFCSESQGMGQIFANRTCRNTWRAGGFETGNDV